MEQRVYYAANITPDALADFLVQTYEQQRRMYAQKLGSDNSLAVQIGRERRQRTPVLTLGITRDEAQNIVVTVGEQNWVSPEMAGHAAMMGVISVLVTPWALFSLLSPARQVLQNQLMPDQLWNHIDTFIVSQGGRMLQQQTLAHPHMG